MCRALKHPKFIYFSSTGVNVKKILIFRVREMIQNVTIDPSVLRLLWKVIAEMNYRELLSLSDLELSEFLIQQVAERVLLSTEEVQNISVYISSNLWLIRDFADVA